MLKNVLIRGMDTFFFTNINTIICRLCKKKKKNNMLVDKLQYFWRKDMVIKDNLIAPYRNIISNMARHVYQTRLMLLVYLFLYNILLLLSFFLCFSLF